MRLSFRSTFQSIIAFPDVELPEFTLLTGPNGAGKTHLLQALANGDVLADCAPNPSADVRMYDFNTLVPQDTGLFSSETLRNERIDVFNNYTNVASRINLPHHLENLRNLARANGLTQTYVQNPVAMASLTLEDLSKLEVKEPENLYRMITVNVQSATDNIINNLSQPQRSRVQAVAKSVGKSVIGLTEDDFGSANPAAWDDIGVFQQSFGRLFIAYRDTKLANDLAEFQAYKGDDTAQFLDADTFRKLHGGAPWDFVNDAVAAAGLDFRINHPNLNEYAPFHPQLTKISNSVTIQFSSLSSGEKVLMAFAFCVYYASDKRQLATPPKLLLLDEVDATLHPSMSQTLIETISRSLIQAYGIKVIMTTHSPSTVALAPESAVHLMTPGIAGIRRCSKAEALNILTVGVPTLSISYEGRRQVFVESPSDAKAYDAAYKILKPSLGSARSLEFIATGTRSKTGSEANTGCEVVKRIVADLAEAGNQSVFGLLDWDGHHASDKRIAVLAEGRRNGLENVIFDPLSIALLICREIPDQRSVVGIPVETNWISFARLDPSLMQQTVDHVTAAVLGGGPKTRTEVHYVGGLKLKIDTRYLTIDDHELESKLTSAFPFLQRVTKQQAGLLIQEIIAKVFADVPDAVPSELRAVMIDLLNRPSH